MSAALSLYDQDFYAWTQEQANLLHNRRFSNLDISHLEEELRIKGASEKRELGNRLKVLLTHLLKWKYQPEYENKKSWQRTIREQRKEIRLHLKDNPSLKNPETFNERFLDAYDTAIMNAAEETGLDESIFSINCEWTIDQVLDSDFYPN